MINNSSALYDLNVNLNVYEKSKLFLLLLIYVIYRSPDLSVAMLTSFSEISLRLDQLPRMAISLHLYNIHLLSCHLGVCFKLPLLPQELFWYWKDKKEYLIAHMWQVS